MACWTTNFGCVAVVLCNFQLHQILNKLALMREDKKQGKNDTVRCKSVHFKGYKTIKQFDCVV
jgi:hypothetical protein